jgi:hypothetical protein
MSSLHNLDKLLRVLQFMRPFFTQLTHAMLKILIILALALQISTEKPECKDSDECSACLSDGSTCAFCEDYCPISSTCNRCPEEDTCAVFATKKQILHK